MRSTGFLRLQHTGVSLVAAERLLIEVRGPLGVLRLRSCGLRALWLRDLSSPTMDRTYITCTAKWILTTGPPGQDFQVALLVKNPPANAGATRDVGSIPGLGRLPGGGHGSSLQSSCPENPMDRGAMELDELDTTEVT